MVPLQIAETNLMAFHHIRVANFAQKRRICHGISKYALVENFYGLFCPRRKAAKICHPVPHEPQLSEV